MLYRLISVINFIWAILYIIYWSVICLVWEDMIFVIYIIWITDDELLLQILLTTWLIHSLSTDSREEILIYDFKVTPADEDISHIKCIARPLSVAHWKKSNSDYVVSFFITTIWRLNTMTKITVKMSACACYNKTYKP